ncbi:unnamed protein product [Hermetia illucens]|uniref:Uncharacterized protein n=1 Tax=Hermetia illucens TaxID=343691 RepID=A0A7R8UYR5_HERIL|nr:unnamed protein product [Hermetia illucens]
MVGRIIYLVMFLMPWNCHRQQCRDDGEVICAKSGEEYKLFTGSCALLAHYCETKEVYVPIPYEQCPPEAFNAPYLCPREDDYICATADDKIYQVFKNHCAYLNFLKTSRKLYWIVNLEHCIGLPDMPSSVCSSIHTIPKRICAFNGIKYQLFHSISALNQKKCRKDGNWRRTSIIYC